jgi:hypothetical protein
MSHEWPQWMHTTLASDYLEKVHSIKLGKVMLTRLRWRGGGPEFHKDGHLVVYGRGALDAFAEKRRRGPFISGADRKVKVRKHAA